jgi:hypothetical protein
MNAMEWLSAYAEKLGDEALLLARRVVAER